MALSAPVKLAAKRIVVIDDDPITCDIVAATLGAAGYRVDVVHDGDDALESIYGATTDLVILDCNLPGKAGMVVLRDIRNDHMLKSLPVIMLTSRTSDWHARLAFETGASAYIKKPFDPAELVILVARALTGASLPQRAL